MMQVMMAVMITNVSFLKLPMLTPFRPLTEKIGLRSLVVVTCIVYVGGTIASSYATSLWAQVSEWVGQDHASELLCNPCTLGVEKQKHVFFLYQQSLSET